MLGPDFRDTSSSSRPPGGFMRSRSRTRGQNARETRSPSPATSTTSTSSESSRSLSRQSVSSDADSIYSVQEDMLRWERHSGRSARDGYRTYRDDEYENDTPTQEELELIIPNPADYNFDRIAEPVLSPMENAWPPQHRALRIVIRKCEKVGCFNLFDLPRLIRIITASPVDRTVHHEFGVGWRDLVVSYAIGPEEFYMSFLEDVDKRHILQKWMSDSIRFSEVTRRNSEAWFLSGQDIQVGKMVSAVHPRDGLYHRAKVLSIHGKISVADVHFVDDGDTRDIFMHNMRGLSSELANLPPFAIRCKLFGVEFTPARLKDTETRQEFLFEIGGSHRVFRTKLMSYDPAADSFAVKIGSLKSKRGRVGPTYYNGLIAKKYQIREKMGPRKPLEVDLDSDTNLMLQNRDVDIHDFRHFKLKGLRSFQITHVESPTDFRVKYIVDYTLPSGGTSWEVEMNNFYRDQQNLHKYKLCTEVPIQNRCYVIHAGSDLAWQRCRVLNRDTETSTCNIMLLDAGMIIEVPFEALVEINPRFTHYCALGFRAYLVDIKPHGGAGTWSKESIAAFKKLTKGKVMYGITVQKETLVLHPKANQLNFILGLIIIEKHQDENPYAKVSINSQLCRMNLADSTGIGSGFVIANDLDMKYNYETMKKSLLKEFPTLVIDELEKNAEKSGASGLVKPGGSSALNANARLAKAMVKMNSKDQPDPCLKFYKHYLSTDTSNPINMNFIPRQIRDSLGICLLSYISSPSCFYVQTMEKAMQIKPMMKYLEALVEVAPEMSSSEIEIGMEVAIFLYDEREAPGWFRGVIRNSIPSINLAKVILVDYGNEVSTKFCSMRRLPEYFRSVPGLAQRVHLDVPTLVPMGGPSCPGWSSDAMDQFRKYLSHWQMDNPIYYVYRPPEAKVFELDYYAQELSFEHRNRSWKKRISELTTAETNTSSRLDKTKPLVKNLVRSIGVDIVYENVTEANEPYKFEKGWDILLQRGVAMTKVLL